MKIFIRTTGERSLEQFKDLDYTVLMDKERTGCKGYFKQLQELSKVDDNILLLEDDIKLRPCFMDCLQSLIKISNNKYIINMSQPIATIKLMDTKNFFWTRAVYYPKGSIAKFMKNYNLDKLNLSKYYDIIQQDLMEDPYIGVPSIMNIIDLNYKSLMKY